MKPLLAAVSFSTRPLLAAVSFITRPLLAAISFLTRIPVGRIASFEWADVARGAGWFPLVGAALGASLAMVAFLLREHLPPALIAALMIVWEVLLTGALHFDALADMADGFGGGRTAEDVLRIMRDHAIGSYGGIALAMLVALKVAAYAILMQRAVWMGLIAAPALGRWPILLLTAMLPYARKDPAKPQLAGRWSLLWGTLTIATGLAVARSLRGAAAAVLVLAVTFAFGRYCRKRIGGITGDTIGANVEISECAALLAFVWSAAR